MRTSENESATSENYHEESQSPVPSTTQPKIVLVVEDDQIILETTIENLHDLGYRTLRASDAAEAMAIIDSGTRIDILFSDVVMPGRMNGVDLAIEARRLRPALRIALTSGYSPAAMDDIPPDVPLLAKPYLQADLAMVLRRITLS